MGLDTLPEEELQDEVEDESFLEGYEQVYGSIIRAANAVDSVDGIGSVEMSYHTDGVNISNADRIAGIASASSTTDVFLEKRFVGVKPLDGYENRSMSSTPKADLREIQIKERKIVDDLLEGFVFYSLDELDTVDEISEGIAHMNSLGVQYRHVHVELKSTMGDEKYRQVYEKYSEKIDAVRKYVKEARRRQKMMNKNAVEVENEKAENKLKRSVLIEEQVFQEKLEHEIENFEAKGIEESKHSCSRFEDLLDEYYNLLSRAKIVFGSEFEGKCKEAFDGTLSRIRQQIKTCKSIVSDLCQKEREYAASKLEKTQRLGVDAFLNKQVKSAEILSHEIELRCKTLIDNCDTTHLGDLNDHQLMERSKNIKDIDIEVREIFGKFSEFSRIIALCGDNEGELKEKTSKMQEDALKWKNKYTTELLEIAASRNIGEKSQNVTIQLPKFKGYNSKLDIYSFKSEFEKLIEPTIPKDYRVDTLRRNYLSGPAYSLVENVEEISEVWEKLFTAYGNTKLLLQNKMAELDEFENLEEINEDEKIANTLSQIINTMNELSVVAKRFKLEYRLYVGGGLEKIFYVIGEDRQRNFLRKNMDKEASPAFSDPTEYEPEVLAEKLEWENLKEFLQKELLLRENLTVLSKRKTCFGINKNSKRKQIEEREEASLIPDASTSKFVHGPEHKCHICGSLNHKVSIDGVGKTYVDYFSCDRFVNMTPKERRITLQRNDFCLQCLSVGVRYDENHLCFDKYVCPDEYHGRFPKGLHVLVCETHKKKEENMELLEQYKKEFINNRYRSWNASKEQERLV